MTLLLVIYVLQPRNMFWSPTHDIENYYIFTNGYTTIIIDCVQYL